MTPTSGPYGPSGNSDVYAVFYVEDNPVYAESEVEISSAQLQNRCGRGLRELERRQRRHRGTARVRHTLLDDDGNAVFIFEGASCAAGAVDGDRRRERRVRTTPSPRCTPSTRRSRPSDPDWQPACGREGGREAPLSARRHSGGPGRSPRSLRPGHDHLSIRPISRVPARLRVRKPTRRVVNSDDTIRGRASSQCAIHHL